MMLTIQKEIFDTFDHPMIGVITVCDIDNHGTSVEIDALLRNAESEVRNEFSPFVSHGRHPNIIAWRNAYKTFGADPHQYRCSAESNDDGIIIKTYIIS